MPQKIDILGLFIDPETITELYLHKRIAVSYPVFYEEGSPKQIFKRIVASEHSLRYDHQEPYGIILDDVEHPDPSNYVMNYKQAMIHKLVRSLSNTAQNITGHISEMLKIDKSGDRRFRILQSGRHIKEVSIRNIPAKVCLSSGQWVDVFKSTPGYNFQGGTPYAVTDVQESTLLIGTKDKNYVIFGAGVDAPDVEVQKAYHILTEIYNAIQAKRDATLESKKKKPVLQLPTINIQIPKISLPKINIQLPNKKKENNSRKPEDEVQIGRAHV